MTCVSHYHIICHHCTWQGYACFLLNLPAVFHIYSRITGLSLPDSSFPIWQTIFYFLSFFLLFYREHKPTWQRAFCLFPSFSKTKSWFQNIYQDKVHTEKRSSVILENLMFEFFLMISFDQALSLFLLFLFLYSDKYNIKIAI